MRPRDTQKTHLYRAEWAVRGENVSKLAQQHLGTIEGCQRYVDEVQAYAWFQRRWPKQKLNVERGRGSNASPWASRIRLAKWGQNEFVVLHELAHILTPTRYAWHGPEFAGVLLFLVERMMGKEYAQKLRAAYKNHRVRHNRNGLPKPERTAVPKAVARQRAAAIKRTPLSRSERMELATLLRRAAAAGQLGDSGTKMRGYANNIARKVEEA